MADEVTALIEKSPFHLNFFAEGISLGRAIGGSILCAHIAKTPHLQVLELRGSTLGHNGCLQLAKALNMHPSLTHLGLARNGVDSSALQEIIAALSVAPLRHFDLEWNGLDNSAAIALAGMLASSECELRTLALERNDIRVPGCTALASALKTNTTLRNLNLAFNRVGNSGANALAAMLASNRTLLTLNLNSNDITIDGGRALVDALGLNSTLVSLNLQGNHCAVAFAERRENLVFSDAFAELNLQGNRINATSVGEDLGHVLQAARKLQALSLSRCGAGDAAFTPILSGISFMTALALVDLSACGIGPIGYPLLADVARSCASLHTLILDQNRLEMAGATHLAAGLVRSSSITCLSLNDCHLADGIKPLAAAMQTKPGVPLRALHLAGNDLDSDGVSVLISALLVPNQDGLIELDLSRNRISSRVAVPVAKLLRHHRGISTVNFRENHMADQLRVNYVDLDSVSRYLAEDGVSIDATNAAVDASSSQLLALDAPASAALVVQQNAAATPSLEVTSNAATPKRGAPTAAALPSALKSTVRSSSPGGRHGTKALAVVDYRDISTAAATPDLSSPVRRKLAASALAPQMHGALTTSSLPSAVEGTSDLNSSSYARGLADIVPLSFSERRVQLHDYEANVSDLCISENQLRLKFADWVSGSSDPRFLSVQEFVRRYMKELIVPLPGDEKRVAALAAKYAAKNEQKDHLDFHAFSVLMLQLVRA